MGGCDKLISEFESSFIYIVPGLQKLCWIPCLIKSTWIMYPCLMDKYASCVLQYRRSKDWVLRVHSALISEQFFYMVNNLLVNVSTLMINDISNALFSTVILRLSFKEWNQAKNIETAAQGSTINNVELIEGIIHTQILNLVIYSLLIVWLLK